MKRTHPDVLFLSEAFTRPRKMHRLAKLGFTQSYTYFTWRNTKSELTDYLTELFDGDGREYLRPNLWPNTPDILSEYLQTGGRPAFMARVTLAATAGRELRASTGPPSSCARRTPREPGSEEYLDSEKYQIRVWDLDDPGLDRARTSRGSTRIRRENPALHDDWNLRFVDVDNEKLLSYVKATDDGSNMVLVVVNLDPYNVQAGWLDVPLAELGLDEDRLLPDARPAERRPLPLVRAPQLRPGRPGERAGARLPAPAAGAHRARLRLLHVRSRWRRRDATGSLLRRTRSGTRTPSSTSSTCGPSTTATATASVTSRA